MVSKKETARRQSSIRAALKFLQDNKENAKPFNVQRVSKKFGIADQTNVLVLQCAIWYCRSLCGHRLHAVSRGSDLHDFLLLTLRFEFSCRFLVSHKF